MGGDIFGFGGKSNDKSRAQRPGLVWPTVVAKGALVDILRYDFFLRKRKSSEDRLSCVSPDPGGPVWPAREECRGRAPANG